MGARGRPKLSSDLGAGCPHEAMRLAAGASDAKETRPTHSAMLCGAIGLWPPLRHTQDLGAYLGSLPNGTAGEKGSDIGESVAGLGS